MDKASFWFDILSGSTAALSGSKSVLVKTTGHEKDQFTVILTARADGKKPPPYIVFKGTGTRLETVSRVSLNLCAVQ